jgi:transposase
MQRQSEAAWERMVKVQDVILRAMARRIRWWQAAEILGISDRNLRRWKRRYEVHGYDGLFDRRKGKPSPKRVPLEQAEEVLRLSQEKYTDLNVRHLHEKLREEHGIGLSSTWVKLALQGAGRGKRGRKRGVQRKRRPRRPLPGMLLPVDGREHRWFQDDRWYDRVEVLDDATSATDDAQLVEEESTRTVMAALKEMIERQGRFGAWYSDRASHFFETPPAGGAEDRQRLTQVGRALKELGIAMIPAYSPQARGRGERRFGTWQGRLPQELRLAGITGAGRSHRFLRERYIPEIIRKFGVAAAERGHAFVPVRGFDLDQIFSVQTERVVAKDNTVRLANRVWQIERTPWRGTLADCRVTICEHLDGRVTIVYGPHGVARYTAEGQSLAVAKKRRAPRCGNDAPWQAWKSQKADFPTLAPALGNPAQTQSAGFPHSHSVDGG